MFHNLSLKNNKGFSVVEVLISLAMASIIIVAVISALASLNKLDTASKMKEKALAYAKQSLEIVDNIKDSEFACHCKSLNPANPNDHDNCATNTCTKVSDNQLCTLPPGYTSCWTRYPDGLNNIPSPYYYNKNSGKLTNIKPSDDTEAPFNREITIKNLARDVNGNMTDTEDNTIFATKKVTTTITWAEQGQNKSINLSTILTAWKNL